MASGAWHVPAVTHSHGDRTAAGALQSCSRRRAVLWRRRYHLLLMGGRRRWRTDRPAYGGGLVLGLAPVVQGFANRYELEPAVLVRRQRANTPANLDFVIIHVFDVVVVNKIFATLPGPTRRVRHSSLTALWRSDESVDLNILHDVSHPFVDLLNVPASSGIPARHLLPALPDEVQQVVVGIAGKALLQPFRPLVGLPHVLKLVLAIAHG
mmetsp:Transcript_5837/g.11764  ORF Transcript_5837/g.11764 Transcript_5837/m.11764 type:complete len:210 (-) Transcript_5837:4106-4735(-)